MSAKLNYQLCPFVTVKMFDEKEKSIGMIKDKVQVVISLPNILEFSENLKETIKMSNTECFIITASSKESTNKIIEEYELCKSLVSLDFKKFANTFNLNCEEKNLKKSLMIINRSCEIVYKDIL